ncbi:MAG TPA: ABC transporter ATP-binding protein [Vicinamibacteria bacterium]|nr:ABC transporter ATP-binding protein [Vicinamibacteria bacterium]
MSRALSSNALQYTYPGGEIPVLRGLSFEIEKGEVFGFLGPNGSGKSTTQKLLTRILTGYQGVVEVFGRDLREHDNTYYNWVGVCFEFPNLYGKLTADENLDFYRRFFDGPTEDPRDVLKRLDLPVGDTRTVGHYSKGMRMRLVLARSLLNRPRLWFLDEPTTGQDPQHAVLIRKLIRERAEAGTTIFLTTHDMTVADELCDRVAFLVDGRIVALDSPRDLKLRHARKLVRVEYRVGDEAQRRDFRLSDEREKKEFLSVVDRHPIETIHTLEPSLEDVFLKLTGRSLD